MSKLPLLALFTLIAAHPGGGCAVYTPLASIEIGVPVRPVARPHVVVVDPYYDQVPYCHGHGRNYHCH